MLLWGRAVRKLNVACATYHGLSSKVPKDGTKRRRRKRPRRHGKRRLLNNEALTELNVPCDTLSPVPEATHTGLEDHDAGALQLV